MAESPALFLKELAAATPAAPPPLRPGEARVVGQTLSPSVAALYDRVSAAWAASGVSRKAATWAVPLTPLPPDVGKAAFRNALAAHLGLRPVRARRCGGCARRAALRG
jgi:hypothetical protein